MVFSSMTFLCVFLPIIFMIHAIVPAMWIKNTLLVIFSIIFYAYGEPVYVLLLLGSALFSYLSALWISGAKQKKGILFLDIFVHLLLLAWFKYAGFLVENVNHIFRLELDVPKIALPIGISFFTFQSMSYVIDVYQGKINVQKNPGKLLLYLSFFPQLIAGPIVKYRDIESEISHRSIGAEEAAKGFQRFLIGLSKKVLIADTMAVVADGIYAADAGQLSFFSAWLGALAYLLQIYYDFSGYSDMAIGMGRMFGFHFRENFHVPYLARGMKDFWKRWHISLTDWFREYLYIPMGGNRKGKWRTAGNKLFVFFCTGLWHGANWTFVFWGLFHAAFLLLEDAVPAIRKLPGWLLHGYTILTACISFVIFRSENMGQCLTMFKAMFSGFGVDGAKMSLFVRYLNPWFIMMFLLGFLGMGILQRIWEKKTAKVDVRSEKKEVILQVGRYAASLTLLILCMLQLAGSTYHPFIYFRF